MTSCGKVLIASPIYRRVRRVKTRGRHLSWPPCLSRDLQAAAGGLGERDEYRRCGGNNR
jgi:hypothetical protein